MPSKTANAMMTTPMMTAVIFFIFLLVWYNGTNIHYSMNETFHKLLNRFLPPEEDGEVSEATEKEVPVPKFTPRNERELMDVLRRTPRSVLSDRERAIIASAMTFADRTVQEVMIPLQQIPYVKEDDYLGPFMLDKLYKSGLSHFPVVGSTGKIVGVIHTESLNSLEIKETDRAKKYLDPHIYFVREDYTLENAMAALLRANCFFFIVLNREMRTVGMLTYADLVRAVFGVVPTDNFTGDVDAFAVAHRNLQR